MPWCFDFTVLTAEYFQEALVRGFTRDSRFDQLSSCAREMVENKDERFNTVINDFSDIIVAMKVVGYMLH